MKQFIHIGMPKTISSALQASLYQQHEQIYYLGVGQKGSPIDYVDSDINFIFETLFLYAKSGYYRQHQYLLKDRFSYHYQTALNQGRNAFGASSEWLAFNFSADMLDPQIKIQRLADMFGQDTTIIVFMRNQPSLLKSLFKEYIKVGLPFSFNEFVHYIFNFKDRNFYYDLFYDHLFQNLLSCFPKNNIHFLPLEFYRDDDYTLLQQNGKIKMIIDLCDILNIKYPDNFNLPHVNPSLNDKQLYHKLTLNQKYRHDFGNLLFEHANIHRSRRFFEKEQVSTSVDYFKDVKLKRFLLDQAEHDSLSSQKTITYDADETIMRQLNQAFAASNIKFADMYGINLPQSYFEC